MRVTRRSLGAAMALSLLAMAPTPGDIGGCGQPVEDLDPELFYRTLEAGDCAACRRCGFGTKSCELACATEKGLSPKFAEGCAPLAHDGEVCLRRLQNESCDDYRPYMADGDDGQAIELASRPRPTECQFCPPRGP